MFGDDLTAALPELQAHAESRMGAANGGSDAAVLRFIGLAPPDSEGYEAEEWATIHAGPMEFANPGRGAATSRTVSTPGGEMQLAVRIAKWPIGTPAFEDGDLIDVAAGVSAGTAWQVVEGVKTTKTAYRVPVVAHNP